MLTLFETLELNVFETYKECAINRASVFLSSSEKSSQLAMSVSYSTELSFFFVIFLKHVDTLAPSWHKNNNFYHVGKRHLTCDEACASFRCSKIERYSAVQTTEATLDKSQILGKWGRENGCL